MPIRINLPYRIQILLVFPPIASIKKRRLVLEKTQAEFANICGVSQSLIAKIERGLVNPSYSIAARIFETLERLEKKESDKLSAAELTAKDIMAKPVVSLKSSDTISKAIKIMLERNFSQLPVIDVNNPSAVVGSLTDRLLIAQDPDNMKVSDVMADAFPIINPRTKISTIRALLSEEAAVLVSDRNLILGIITKYDLLKAASPEQ